MWTEEYKTITKQKIILLVLCVVVAAGLLLAMLKVRAGVKEEEAVLKQQYDQQQLAQTEASKKEIQDIETEYYKDTSVVLQYLPGIVCWGDTLTAGSSGAVSYVDILQKSINAYICDVYDFRSTIDNADEYSRLDWDDYTVSIPVVNMGVAGENTYTILGRSGVAAYVLSEDVTIPASADPVEISILSPSGKNVYPLVRGDGGVNNVSIAGIEGKLSLSTDDKNKIQYYFTRLTPDSECIVKANTPVVTYASDMYTDYIHIVCIGTCGGYKDADELAQQIRLLLSRQTNNTDRYLVLGLCYQGDWCDLSNLDAVMTQYFGEHYLNIRQYLCSDGMSDAGITPSKEDIQNAKKGIVPASLRSPSGDEGLSVAAYKIIGSYVYNRMNKLGYFNEVIKELEIENARKELLKKDPYYFNNIVKSW